MTRFSETESGVNGNKSVGIPGDTEISAEENEQLQKKKGEHFNQLNLLIKGVSACSMTAPVPPDDVMQRAQAVFADVQDEFCDVKKILSRFEEWRGSYADSYHSAYISLCLPKLLNPIIRHQLLVWNPLKVHIVHELHLVPCIR